MEWCHLWYCWHHMTLTLASMALHDQRNSVVHYFNHLDLIKTMVLLTMPSCASDTSATKVKWLKKSYCISLNHLGLTNTLVPLMMPSVLCNAKTGIPSQKSHVALCFSHLHLIKKIVPLTISSVGCDANTGAKNITWLREPCHTLFELSSPNEQNGAINDVVSITWQQCWYK